MSGFYNKRQTKLWCIHQLVLTASSYRMLMVASHFTGELTPWVILSSLTMLKLWRMLVENRLRRSPKVWDNHNQPTKIIRSIFENSKSSKVQLLFFLVLWSPAAFLVRFLLHYVWGIAELRASSERGQAGAKGRQQRWSMRHNLRSRCRGQEGCRQHS
jgi:hypothetical protein